MEDVNNLFYMRDATCPSGKWAAEICLRGKDNVYTSVEISDSQLLNFLRVAAEIVSKRGILKLTPEQLEQLGEHDENFNINYSSHSINRNSKCWHYLPHRLLGNDHLHRYKQW